MSNSNTGSSAGQTPGACVQETVNVEAWKRLVQRAFDEGFLYGMGRLTNAVAWDRSDTRLELFELAETPAPAPETGQSESQELEGDCTNQHPPSQVAGEQ